MRREDTVADWSRTTVAKVVRRHFSGPSPTCEERTVEDNEWGLLKTTAVTWNGWNPTAHKVLPRSYWGSSQLEVRDGDVVVTKAGPRQRVGVVALASGVPPRLIVSGKMVALRPDVEQVLPPILAGLLGVSEAQAFLNERTTGMAESQVNFTNQVVLSTPLLVPPMPEQQRIMYLANSMDELIHASQLLISKLEQRRQAMLQELLEDQAGRADDTCFSTAEHEFEIKAGITLGQHRRPRRNARRYLRVANVQRGKLDLREVALLEASDAELPSYALRSGDILLVEGHANPNEIGRCALVRHDMGLMLFQNHLFRLRCRRVEPEFAHLWLNSSDARNYWYRMCATSSGLYTVNSRSLSALPIWVPEPATQARIVRTIRAEDGRLDLERRSIAKLRQLKAGLMADLLTGQVRVKDAEGLVEKEM